MISRVLGYGLVLALVGVVTASAPAGICPCHYPVPGEVVAAPLPHRAYFFPNAVVRQPDGNIVVVGSLILGSASSAAGPSVGAIVRLDRTGEPDRAFGSAGLVTMYPNRSFDVGEAVAVQPDGKILVAGLSGRTAVIARYESDGTLDRGFGREGIARAPGPVKANPLRTLALRVLSDATVVVVRVAQQATSADHRIPGGIFITRLRSDGTHVSTVNFSAPERVIGETIEYGSWASAIVLANGSVITVGLVAAPNAVGCNRCELHMQLIVRRFRPDGSPDATFGADGCVRDGSDDTFSREVAFQGDDLLVAGALIFPEHSSTTDFALVRYDETGTRVAGFGANGIARKYIGSMEVCGNFDDYLVSVTPRADGTATVLGNIGGRPVMMRIWL